MKQIITLIATLIALLGCSEQKEQVRWVANPFETYFFPSMNTGDLAKGLADTLHYGDSVILLEASGKVVYHSDSVLINLYTKDTTYWCKVRWKGKEGYTFINVLSDTAITGNYTVHANIEPDNNEYHEKTFALTNTKNETLQFDLEGLKALLFSERWSMGYDNINFNADNTYTAGTQEGYTGAWSLDNSGKIRIYSSLEATEPSKELRFENTYTLVNHVGGSTEYYSDAYYQSFSISPESQKASEIHLNQINKNTLKGTWVTDEQGPMGELFGYKFYDNDFYLGHNSLSELHGYWDDSNYQHGGYWQYNKTENKITMFYTKSKSENPDTITIYISKFYNAAFEGTIKSTFYIDEGGNYPRTFFKSMGKAN